MNTKNQISFVTPWLPSVVDHLKVCALYFDSIKIRQRDLLSVEPKDHNLDSFYMKQVPGQINQIIPLINNKFKNTLSLLINEKLIEIVEDNSSNIETERYLSEISKFNDDSNPLSNIPLFKKFEREGTKSFKVALEPEATQIHDKFIGPITRIGDTLRLDFLDNYYSGLFLDVLKSFDQKMPVITGSNIIYNYINSVFESEQQLKKIILSGKIAYDAISVTLIDVRQMTFEEILDARHHLRTELEAFRSTLDQLQFDFINEFGAEKILKEGKEIASHRVLPALKDLESRAKSLKYSVFKKLLDVLKKPDPYVPLVGSTFTNIPFEIATLFSLGLVSIEVVSDLLNDRRTISNNGLYYLLKLRKKRQKFLPETANSSKNTMLIKNSSKNVIYTWPEFVTPLKKN